MKTDPVSPNRIRLTALTICLALLAGCAAPLPRATQPPDIAAARELGEARSLHFKAEERAAHYLNAAALTAPRLGSGTDATPAREIYNASAAEVTVLLRSQDGGRLWNQPLTITGDNTTYHLRLQGSGSGMWPATYFSSFEDSKKITSKLIKEEKEITRQGVGGTLVGVRSANPPDKFAGPKGLTAPVTATLDFHGSDASLALRNPDSESSANIEGKSRLLAANFSAPFSYYRPPNNLMLYGLMRGFRGENYTEKTGLYFLEPYDPDRIPVVFVHGLFSTPFTWVQTINGLQLNPEVRKRYQPWVFSYTTGNPILFSALQLRDELARVDRLYPNHKPYVIVGHSMGGMLTHAQVTTVTRAMWENDKNLGATAKSIFAKNPSDGLVVRSMVYNANPRIKRVVFVCTPHRGSNLATSGIGGLGISLIRLPRKLASTVTDSLTGENLAQITGNAKRLPNSVSGLKPTNPALPIVNAPRMTVPYHSIIGDRGKGNSPNSTDGVVAYWSSHLDGAKSEKIVPGPHGSTALPETIAELDRILKLHLASQ